MLQNNNSFGVCVPSEGLDHPANLKSPIRIFAGRSFGSQCPINFRTDSTDTDQADCLGSSESSLDSHAKLYLC